MKNHHAVEQSTRLEGLELVYTAKCSCGWSVERPGRDSIGQAIAKHLTHFGKVEAKNPHAVELGRKGGSVRSEAKARAARENARKPRPRPDKMPTPPTSTPNPNV